MEKIYPRKLKERILKFIDRREIIGIRGARQTGKTTLLKIIYDNIRGSKIFINLDLPRYRRALEENPLDFVKRFKESRELFLFLDEVQRIENCGEILKIIYDEYPDVKIFISGSSSLELKTNILPFLVGRLFIFELYTFDFEEFLTAKDKSLARIFRAKNESIRRFLDTGEDIEEPSFSEEFLDYWKEYVIYGGYPEVVKTDDFDMKKMILRNIFELYLEKDITAFFRITDYKKFEDLVRFLAFKISNMISVSSIASDLKIGYKEVEKYLEILEHTYVIKLLRPFYKNLVTEIKKAPKIYFLDLGLRNTVIDNFIPFDNRVDKGELSENHVFRELIINFDGWKIHYWRTTGKAEVDFILERDGEIIPLEVKLSGERLGKSFYSFIKTYKPSKAVIISLNKFYKRSIEGTKIFWIPIFYI